MEKQTTAMHITPIITHHSVASTLHSKEIFLRLLYLWTFLKFQLTKARPTILQNSFHRCFLNLHLQSKMCRSVKFDWGRSLHLHMQSVYPSSSVACRYVSTKYLLLAWSIKTNPLSFAYLQASFHLLYTAALPFPPQPPPSLLGQNRAWALKD